MVRVFTVSLPLFFLASLAAADETECRWLEADRLAEQLCTCRQIESDIQRLRCFDQQTVLEMALRRQAAARAEWLSKQPFGIEAMRNQLGDQSN